MISSYVFVFRHRAHHGNITRHVVRFLIGLFRDPFRFTFDESLLQNIRLHTLLFADPAERLIEPRNGLVLSLSVIAHTLFKTIHHRLSLWIELGRDIVVGHVGLLHGSRIGDVLDVTVVAHLLKHVRIATRKICVHSIHR